MPLPWYFCPVVLGLDDSKPTDKVRRVDSVATSRLLEGMPTTRLLLLRHGQTEFNLGGIYQGRMDSPLTQEGIDQARALAPRLHAMDTCATLYCSDLGRARQTAQLIADPAHHRVAEDAGLAERHFGIFQGLPKADIPAQYPEEWARHYSGDPDYVVPGGESQRQLHDRVVAAVDRIVAPHQGELVVAVTHGGALGSFVKHVLGLDVAARRRFDMGNTSISSFYLDDDERWMVRFFGDLAHLDNLPDPNQTEG